MAVTLAGGGESFDAEAMMFGDFNAMNMLEALVAAREVIGKVKPAAGARLAGALRGLDLPAGRLARVSAPRDDIDVFVDFAHTPDALASLLAGVQEAAGPGRRVCVVFGCGGDRDRAKRPEMGAIAAAGADRIIITSDNPRREAPSAIVEQIIAGMDAASRARMEVHVDRAAAIRRAIGSAAPGDVVVIAGKGHERVQVLPVLGEAGGVVERVFDDAEHAARALAERRALPRGVAG
jgi:UDP-N-acetylmuramoyl-L-alanyl-D-glutamate--2,6-diaminopimelate ligase